MTVFSFARSRAAGRYLSTINVRATRAALLASLALTLFACGGGGGADSGTSPDPTPPVSGPTPAPPPPPWPPPPAPNPTPPAEPDPVPELGFEKVSDADWDETAVRKVLDVFAYGGQATDAQVTLWADLTPVLAIRQMLNFDEHNLRLSPATPVDTDALAIRDGTLAGLGAFWSSDDAANGTPSDRRRLYDETIYSRAVENVWARSATSRGLNPFRAKIGFWETNYHLAVNRDAVEQRPVLSYYDGITEALESDFSYADVLTSAATSAAIAVQYGHRKNRFVNGECECNEDFAREYHQLFFGILGDYDSTTHETVTIKNTAAALTDMPVNRTPDGKLETTVTFGTERHYQGSLQILDTLVNGSTAEERFVALAEDAIRHPESLQNLPVMIVAGLADDNLDAEAIEQIRDAWDRLGVKNIANFLRAYAISTLFHREQRVKFYSSIDRHLMLINKIQQSNREGNLLLYTPTRYRLEGVRAFHPEHNVFGGQTGLEAADSGQVFRNNFNSVTDDYGHYRRFELERDGETWQQDWGALAPRDADNQFVVRDVAEWLWQRVVSDGLKNFGALERAHVYALLGSDFDLVRLASPDDLERVYLSSDIATDAELLALLSNLAASTMTLDSADENERAEANLRVGQAINFIVATPFVFAQEGR